MSVKFSNNATTELASSIGTLNTSITVVDASKFPILTAGDYTYVTLDTDTASPTREIVRVTAISGNVLTVTRGQDGTSPASFAAGTKVELRLTAALLNDAADITSADVTSALGYTPYNATNPAGYTTNVGTVTSASGTGTVSGLTLTGSVTSSGSLTLGGTLSLTSGDVTTGLGFTPYNATNPSAYISGNQTVTVSGDASGSGATSIALALANSGVAAGTYTKVTVDAKGRVTTGASLASGDLPTYTGTITSGQVTTGLGFTPYNATNPSAYITSSSLSSYLPLSGGTLTGVLYTNGTSSALATSDHRRIMHPGGASYVTQTSSVTGAIKIKMPLLGSAMMMMATVRVYEYSTGKSFELVYGGHRDGSNWYNEFAYIIGDESRGDISVRFGIDGTSDCVWIGETNTVWSYPQVWVTDVQIGFAGYSANWHIGWSVSFVASFDTVNRTRTAFRKLTSSNYTSYSPSLTGSGASGTWGISISGNAATATSATDSTKLPLSGGTLTGALTANAGGRFLAPADEFFSFTNVDSGSTHFVQRGARLLTSNGSNWAADGKDPVVVISRDSAGLTRGQSLGLAFHNENNTDNSYSPAIVFSAKSNSGSYNSMYAGIMGKKTGANAGVDSNWNKGELHFYAVGDAYAADTPNFSLSGNLATFRDGARMGTFANSQNNTGEAWIGRASDRAAGTMTVQLGSGADRSFEVVDNAWTQVIFNAGMNTFTYKGNAVIHAGNYTSYLSGSASATFLNSSNYINRTGSSGSTAVNFQNTPAGSKRYQGDDSNVADSPGGTWWHYEHMRHSNASNYWGTTVAWGWEDNANKLAVRNIRANSFEGWVYYLNSSNYSSYALPLSGGTIAGNGSIDFGPNSSWGVTLRVGGNGHGGSTRASVVTTNGNLHIDAAANLGVYFGWYNSGTTGVYFGNGAAGQVGRIDGAGNASFSGSITAGNGMTVNAAVINAPQGYVSNSNPWSTSNSAFFPNGITTANATNWMYGNCYLGNAPSNGSGAQIESNGKFFNSTSSGVAMHVRRTGSAGTATNSYTALFEQTMGDHSWGIVAEFRAGGSGGSDRPSILFSNGYNSTTWSVGFGYYDDQFRINQNHGYRNSGWGTERFRIDTGGIAYLNGNVALHAGNYTSYAPTVGSTNNLTNIWYFLSNRDTSSNSPPLQAASTSGGAIMSFHRHGVFAINMGLDSDNVFRIGGWSAATNRLQMDMSGNLTMAGNVTAYSDERLKKDWSPIYDGFVDRLAVIRAGTYTRIDSGDRQAGVSAQAMRELLPEVVSEDNDGTLALAYGNAAMVSAIELARELVALKRKVTELEARIH